MAVKRSTGKYVWFLGDDDKIAAGGIQKVLNILRDHPKLSLIFMNCKVFDRNFDECLEEKSVDIERDILLQKADGFFQTIGNGVGLLPTIIVRRDIWLLVEKNRYEGTGWLHITTLFSLLPGHLSYYISTPYSLMRGGSERWHEKGEFLKMAMVLVDIYKALPEYGYKKDTVKILLDPILRGIPLSIFTAKRKGLLVNFSLIKKMIIQFSSSPSFWLLGIPLLLLPSGVCQSIWKVRSAPLVKYVFKGVRRILETS